jgi:crotonobetainyl-CoA:carnitine CoA-transferase CaiB-like acyl-CoA transferase
VTGQGSCIDISEYEAACSTLGPALLDYSINGQTAGPAGNRSEWPLAAPHGCYRCKGEDCWCVIAVFSENEWHSICRVMGEPQWAQQEKFSIAQSRMDNADELDTLIGEWTAGYMPHEVMGMLQAAGVPAAAVNDARDLANDPHLNGRDFFVKMKHPLLGMIKSDGNPIRLSTTPPQYNKAAPLLGEDNQRVFIDILGMDEDKFKRYVAEGIIA